MTRVTELRWSEIGERYQRTLSNQTKVTRRGLRVMLIAIHHHDHEDGPLWRQIWAANVWAYREALATWHVRIPSRHADHDRARVAWLLNSTVGGFWPPSDEERRALAWASNRSTN